MSIVGMLMVGGWVTTLSMIGFCSLRDAGKLVNIRRRMALWLYPAMSVETYIGRRTEAPGLVAAGDAD